MEEEAIVAESIRGLEGMQVITPEGNLFEEGGWSTDRPAPKAEPAKPEGDGAADKNKPKLDNANEEIVDEHEYLEKQTGYKTWDEVKAAKTELEQLRAKPQTAAERKFANEESRKLAEAWEAGETDKVFEYLSTQRQLKKADSLPAAEAIKMHLQQTNPHFKPEDVDDVFEERYSLPKKPVQGVAEEAEDFQERMTEYNTRVAKVNRAIERDAVTAKQDLAKRITELVPPEIPQKQGSQGPTQEALDARKTYLEDYVKAVPKEIESFKGFSTTFKDEAVEIPISYGVTPEEMKEFQAELEGFAEKGLDTNTLFSERWVNKDGSVNIKQMAEDRYLLKNRDKIFQKIANESGAQRLAHQMKLNSNIKVDGGTKVVKMDKSEINSQKDAIDQLWKNG